MHYPSSRLKPLALATALAFFAAGLSTQALAQQGAPAVTISLKAQPLGSALNELARQAGLQLLANPEVLANKQAPAVQGTLTVRQALDKLLEGSGLVAKLDGNAVTIQVLAPSAAATKDAQLAEVIVQSSSEATSRYYGASSNAAARLPADPMDLPVAGVSIPKAVMEDQGVIRAAEAVRNVSAVTRNPAYLGLTDSYRIRGFQSDIGLWNGFRRDFYYSFTDTAHLERVEVIKGPASVTYGDLEPGGVVNYVTKRPSRTPINSVQFTTGSNKLLRPEFDLGVVAGEDQSVRMRLTGAHEQAGSFKDHIESRHSTLGATLDWDIQPGTRLELSGYWLDSKNTPDRGFFNSMGPVALQLPRERFLGEPADTYTFKQTDLSALLSHRLSKTWSLRGGINRYHVEDVRDNVQFRNMLADGRTMRRQYTYVPSTNKNTTLFAEVRGDFNMGNVAHTLVAGVEQVQKDYLYDFRRDRSSSYAIDIFSPVYGQYARVRAPQDRYETDSTSRSFYAQNLMAIGEHWRVLAGLRYTHYKQKNRGLDGGSVAANGSAESSLDKSEATPRLGVLYKFNPENSAFVSYARSFNPQFSNYAYLAPGADPKPERGTQYEAGYKFTALDESVVAGATLFQITKENVATTHPSDPNLMIISGEQRVRGIEFDLNAKLGSGWSVIGSYARLKSEVTRDPTLPVGDRLVNTPSNQASLWVRHDFASLPGAGVGLGAFYVGEREAQLPNTWKIPGYTRFDASFYWKINPKTDLNLHLKNLTDKTYYDSQGNLLYVGAPRSALLSIKYKF